LKPMNQFDLGGRCHGLSFVLQAIARA